MNKSVNAQMGRIKASIYRKNIAPCKGCEDRCVGCHGSCQKYMDWREACFKENCELRSKVLEHYGGSKDETRRLKCIKARRKARQKGMSNLTPYERKQGYIPD